MKKYAKKLTAGLVAFAMVASSMTPTAMVVSAAPEDSAASSEEITLSATAETNLASAKIISSLNEEEETSTADYSGLKAAIRDAIFNGYNDKTDLSAYNASEEEVTVTTEEVLAETNMADAVEVTYETDSDGTVVAAEVEMDPMVAMAAEELEANATVYGLTEEQSQNLLGMYSQYLQLYEDNADMFGVQVPYNTTRDTNSSPIGSLLDVASIPEAYAQAGYIGYDVLSGIIQLYYLGTQFAVQEYKDDVIAGRNEALSVLTDDMTEMQKYLALNDWMANECQFAMDYIMKEMVQPEPKANELYEYAYNCAYNMIRSQVYDAAKEAMLNYGMDEATAKAQADATADAFMVDVDEENGSGEQQAASLASSIVGMWGSNQVGFFVNKKAVCFGYADVYAYLLQCAHPEIYLKDPSAGLDDASNWKSYTELNYELGTDGNPVKDEDGNYQWSEDSAAIVDYVKIVFNANVTMFGQEAPFGEAHYWNAVKLDGEWYYVDPCYVDIYVECMNRDRVETDGNLNHLYFMFSDDSCRDMYEDNYKEIRTLYEGIATDKTYEEAWVAFVKSQPYQVGKKIYYLYDSTDLLEIMNDYGNGSSSSSSRASDNSNISDYEGLFQDTEYKIVYHDNASMDDTSDTYASLIDFNNGQVYNPTTGELEDNALIAELYAEHEEYVKEYPSISISCAYYDGKIYFSLSNCVLSYDLETGAIEKLIEYTEVSGERDMSNGLGGLAFTMTNDAVSENGITVQNPPIADMTIKTDGKMYVSVATNYAFISGKDFGELTDYSSYGYKFAETNYEPSYNTYYNSDEENDNDEFMWSANIVGTIEMSHLTGTQHTSETVTVPASCTEDEYTVTRCTECGKILEDTTVEQTAETTNAEENDAVVSVSVYDAAAAEGADPICKIDIVKEGNEELKGQDVIVEATEIIAEVEKAEELKEYILDETTVPEKTTAVYGGDAVPVKLTATKKATDAKATVNIYVFDADTVGQESAEPIYITTLETKTGLEGEETSYSADEIKAALETEKFADYKLDESSVPEEVTVVYGGAPEPVNLTATKKATDAKATVNIYVYDADMAEQEGAEPIYTATLDSKIGREGDETTYSADEIKAALETEKFADYKLDESSVPSEVKVVYGGTPESVKLTATKKATDAKATVNIYVYDAEAVEQEGAEPIYTVTLNDKVGREGDETSYSAAEIKEALEIEKFADYKLDESSVPEEVTVVYGGDAVPVKLTATKKATDAKATLNIYVYDAETAGQDGVEPIYTVTLNDKVGREGDTATYNADEIKAAIDTEKLVNYVLDESSVPESVDATYGGEAVPVKLTASKETGDATLIIKVLDSATASDEEPTVVLEKTVTESGYKGETITYDATTIKSLVGDISGYTLDEDSLPTEEVTVTYGGDPETVTLTATANPTGTGHRYIKFDETYYTKVDKDDANSAWNEGTSYVCIDCGHAFELDEDDETIEDNLRSNDVVLTDDEVAAYAKNLTEVWTWSTDKTEASLYLVPTELMDHKFDCVWENPSLSKRGVATVTGDCETGEFTATVTLNGKEYTKTETVEKHNHSYLNQEETDDDGNVTQEAAVQWTWADDYSSAEASFTCDVCGKTEKVTASGDAIAVSGQTEATCTEDGSITYQATVTVDDINYLSSRSKETDPATGHTYGEDAEPEWDWVQEEDESYSSATATFTCTACGEEETVDAAIEKTIDREAGKTIFTATATMGDNTYTDTKEVDKILDKANPFVDVDEDDYFYDAVLWAVDKGITTGYDESHFAPLDNCTRAGVVTFLWRTVGKPEVKTTENPFVDVSEDDYYYTAVLWAYENGITKGMDETHFAPNENVTRGQFVTFMYREKGEPEYTVENPFEDVKENEYYTDAVLWAYENKITTGTDATHFAPDDNSIRGDVITFLYRGYAEK